MSQADQADQADLIESDPLIALTPAVLRLPFRCPLLDFIASFDWFL